MPFTFCHPAAVLPFNYLPRKWRSLTGLVAGSVAPDFEYFLRVSHSSRYSHTIPGLFWFDLPMGIIIAVVFHKLVRDPLILNLPAPLQRKASHYYKCHWIESLKNRWFIVICSVFAGAITHLLWDGFTHETADTLKTLPFKEDFRTITRGKLNAYSLYTEVTSIVGAAIIFYAIWQLPLKKRIAEMTYRKKYWLGIGLITAVLFCTFYFSGFGDSFEGYIIDFIDALILSMLFLSIVIYFAPKKKYSLS